MVEDLPNVAAAEQRLRQAERLEAVGRLAGGVAHDFNNLLTGVLLYCDLLMADLEPTHRARKYAKEIRNAGLQAAGLVRQLLAIARPRNAQARPVSLNEIAEGMRNLLVRLIGENIELKLRLDPNLGLIKMDPVNAQQILLNLVLNARDAMPAGGQISIETGNCKVQILAEQALTEPVPCKKGLGANCNTRLACALFAVEDNGTGMDENTRAHLFEPFFTTKAGKGTGIGLATVHDIVSTSGGLIHVQSEPGCGTRVSVLLPLVPENDPPPANFNSFHSASNVEVLSSIKEESTL
jgi:signal transduction histidine kinase